MQSLKNVISALTREIDAALTANIELSNGTRLEADRIVLSLALTIQPPATKDGSIECSFCVLDSGDKGSLGVAKGAVGHPTLTIEFRTASAARSESGSANSTPTSRHLEAHLTRVGKAVRLEGAEADRVTKLLGGLFGTPGFDSAARATVFREALGGFTDTDAGTVVASLKIAPASDSDEVTKRARHLIARVLKSGPIGSVERGGEVLAEIFGRHSVKSVLRLIEEQWKTQTEWL